MQGIEDRNRASMALDQMCCEEIVRLMNAEDQRMVNVDLERIRGVGLSAITVLILTKSCGFPAPTARRRTS